MFPIAQGGAYRDRFGAPFVGIPRADLQHVLGAAHGPDRLHLGHRLVALSEKNNVVKLDFANGSSAEVDVLVGADGQRSIVRRYVAGEERAAYSGTSGFRGIVSVRDLPSLPDPHALQFWMGPNAHLLHYAIGPSGLDINFLAVVEGPISWTHENWVAPVAHDEAVAAFKGLIVVVSKLPDTNPLKRLLTALCYRLGATLAAGAIAIPLEPIPGIDLAYDIGVPIALIWYWFTFFRDAHRTISHTSSHREPSPIANPSERCESQAAVHTASNSNGVAQ